MLNIKLFIVLLQLFLLNGCLAQHQFKDLTCFIEIIILSLAISKLHYDHIQPIIIILLNLVIIIIIINLHDLHKLQTAGINKFF